MDSHRRPPSKKHPKSLMWLLSHSIPISPAVPSPPPPPRRQRLRPRSLLAICCCSLLALGQLLLFHRRLLPSLGGPGSPSSSTQKAAAMLAFGHSAAMEAAHESLNDSIRHPSSNGTNDIKKSLHQLPLQQRLPDFLVIGVRKGGTRALLDALALHPNIRVARHEVHFFDNEENYRRGPDWYRAQMPAADLERVIIGEKTPAYFTANVKVPSRVFQLKPEMKLLLIVREPVTRTVSDFTQIQQTKRERHKPALDFQRMSLAMANGSSIAARLNTRFKPIRNSLYADHLQRWLNFFPLKQFLVLNGDKFIEDPLSQLRIAERFLGLEPAIRQEQLVFDRQKGFFCFRQTQNASAHCLGQSKGRKQIRIPAQFRQELAHLFTPYNRRFFALLNKQIPGWS